MIFKCFPLVCPRTKARMQRRKWRFGKNGGKTYHYIPQERLIKRLAIELEMTHDQVREQIFTERLYLLRELYGENEISAKDV